MTKRKMSSYQRRKKEIKYLWQRNKEVEECLITALIAARKKLGKSFILPLSSTGIAGDDFITDISSGDFHMRIMSAVIEREKER